MRDSGESKKFSEPTISLIFFRAGGAIISWSKRNEFSQENQGFHRLRTASPLQLKLPSHGTRNCSGLFHQPGEGFGGQRLVAVRKSFGRVRVDFDDQTVCPGGDRRPAHRKDEVVPAGAVAGI